MVFALFHHQISTERQQVDSHLDIILIIFGNSFSNQWCWAAEALRQQWLTSLWSVKVAFGMQQETASPIQRCHGHSARCIYTPWFAYGVYSWREMLNSSSGPFKLLAVTLSFFFSTSLIILRCAFEVILAGRPLLWRVSTELNRFHLLRVCLTVDWWILELFEITLKPFLALC